MRKIKHQDIIESSIRNNARKIAFEYIERVAHGQQLNVLEITQASGQFINTAKLAGHQVTTLQPDCRSAQIAETRQAEIFTRLIADFRTRLPDTKFDVVILEDVLDPNAAPQQVLVQCHELLAEGGAMIVSAANVAHHPLPPILADSAAQGADSSHSPGFSRKTITELCIDCEYVVIDLQAVTLTELSQDESQARVDDRETRLSDDGKDAVQYSLLAVPAQARTGRAYQLLSANPKTKVLALAQNIEQSHFNVRLGEPLRAWAAQYEGECLFQTFDACNKQHILWADVLVIQRRLDIRVLKIISFAAMAGKRIIFEIDDLVMHIPEFLSHHQTTLTGYESALSMALRQVHCITVTTPRLAEQLARFSKPIITIPNCATEHALPRIDTSAWKKDIATLVVAASDAVLVDFVLPAIAQVMQRPDMQIHVLVIGPIGAAFDQAGIPCERLPNLTYDAFKARIRDIDNPIGIIPLDDSLFSSCKSPVKYFDYSLAGIPVICSDVPPYADVIQRGVNGLLIAQNTTTYWVQAIEQLVKSVPLRKALATQAAALVENEYATTNAAQHWNKLLHKLNHGSFDFGPVAIPTYTEKKALQLKLLLTHCARPASYKAMVRVLKRDGFKSLASRIFSMPL